ncbi:MAG: tRNA 2-selenouridine(34) synthase MnmH [Flavobacteriales bacterium]|nr:tRNA 2-selenouridine(34) synthase MnmH [Flavobacteriales bacterium]
MIRVCRVEEFLADEHPVIDVRSPGEFARGHIPGARSLPLFTDEERAVVGTLYKQQGRDTAVLEGLRIVGPKLSLIVEEVRSIATDGHIGVHCWRGGERSGSVAWLLDKAGFNTVSTMKGGYKAFRNHVLTSFNNTFNIRIIGGYTGTGKTELLGHLRALGERTLDLEGLANHKGSSFGAIGEAPQPTTEQFENELWNALRMIDPNKTGWVEDESQMIGRLKIPDPFFQQMRAAQCTFADMPREERAARLVKDYGKYPKEQLAEATKRIEKRLGPQHCKAALEALATGDLYTVAMITLAYYDKTYLHGLEMRDPQRTHRIAASSTDMFTIAKNAIAAHGK